MELLSSDRIKEGVFLKLLPVVSADRLKVCLDADVLLSDIKGKETDHPEVVELKARETVVIPNNKTVAFRMGRVANMQRKEIPTTHAVQTPIRESSVYECRLCPSGT